MPSNPPIPINIFYPNGRVEGVQVFIWNAGTLQPVVWDGSLTASSVVIGVVSLKRATTAAQSNVSASATSVNLLAINAARILYSVFNDSTSAMYIKHGTTAATTDFKIKVAAGAYWSTDEYTGRVDAIWDSATGTARVTEET
jgi:hypothetical protein